MYEQLNLIFTLTGFVGVFLLQFAAIIRRISLAEHNIQIRIENVEHELEKEIQKVRQELVESELDIAKSYMRRETFKDVMSNIDSRLIRLEGKLDAAIAGQK